MPIYERNNQALQLKTHNQSINQSLNPTFQYFSTGISFSFFVCLTLNYCWKFNFKNFTILQPPHDIAFRRVRYWRVLIGRKLNSIHLYVNKWVLNTIQSERLCLRHWTLVRMGTVLKLYEITLSIHDVVFKDKLRAQKYHEGSKYMSFSSGNCSFLLSSVFTAALSYNVGGKCRSFYVFVWTVGFLYHSASVRFCFHKSALSFTILHGLTRQNAQWSILVNLEIE